MIDIHTHILPNIDDGAQTLTQSLEMINEACNAGFTSIICTPHYSQNKYDTPIETIEELINKLQNYLPENIKLYIGAEVYISTDIDVLVKQKMVSTLNNSKYILFELPMHTKVIYMEEVVDKLLQSGLIPVLAHPERYTYLQKNMDVYQKLIEKGVLFQCNFGSIISYYGKNAKRTIKKLLKNDMVHFLATDTHRPNTIYKDMNKILKKLGKIITKDKIELLTKVNQKCMIK
jgi:protein-tyrosine phosphatase